MSEHIQITCYPRSGSTLLLQLLFSTVDNYTVFAEEKSADHYMDLNCNSIGKRPLDLLIADRLIAKYDRAKKNLKWILIKRDIRSVITSIHENVPDDYFIGYEYSYRTSGYKLAYKNNYEGIKSMYRGMREVEGSPNTCVIKYEDLLEDPIMVQKIIGYSLSIDYSKPFTQVKEEEIPPHLLVNNVIPEIQRERRNKWFDHKERIIEQFTIFPQLHSILIEDGYEENTEWFEKFTK